MAGIKKLRTFATQFGKRPHWRPHKQLRFDSVAQLVEQLTLNQWVESSSLSGVTKQNGKTLQIAETKIVSAIFVIPLSGRIVNIVRYGGVQFVNS